MPHPPGDDVRGIVAPGAVLAGTLRRLRRERGISQRELARALGLSAHSGIADYEAGRRLPPNDIIISYETYFRAPPGHLQALRREVLLERAAQEPDPHTQVEPDAAGTATHDAHPAARSQAPPVTGSPARTGTDLGEQPAGPGRVPLPDRTGDRNESMKVDMQDHADSSPAGPRRPRTGRPPRRRPPLRYLVAVPVLGVAAAAVAIVGPWRHAPARAASTAAGEPVNRWAPGVRNQHVTDPAERVTPEPMDGDDPRARSCIDDAVTVVQVPLLLADGTTFGTLRLRHSARCGTSWGSAYYANPHLYTVHIAAHRPTDGAEVSSEWPNNTPPGSYGDMLSTGTGCVWVEAWVVTGPEPAPHAHTPCR